MRLRTPITMLLAGLCIALTGMSQAGMPRVYTLYTVDPQTGIHNLQSVTNIMVDSSKKLTIDDVSGGRFNQAFTPLEGFKGKIQPGIAYWLKLNISSDKGFKDWWLIVGSANPLHQYYINQYHAGNCYVDVYQQIYNGARTHLKAGTFVSRSQRSVKEMPAINRVLFSVQPGQTQTVYVRIFNKFSETAPLPLPELRDPSIPIPSPAITVSLVAASAVMAILAILSFFFYFFVRDKSYLFFTCYLLLLSTHYQILNPEQPLLNLLVPERPWLILDLWTILTLGAFMFYLLFGRCFISLPKLSRTTDRFWKYLVVAFALGIVFNLVSVHVFETDFANGAIFFILFAAMLGFMIRIAFFKSALARIFVVGALWLVVWSILGGIWNSGALWLPVNPWFTAQIGQLLIYCFGLAYKVRLNEKARAEAEHIKELDEIKSRFFANISHEFRTPLTLIRGPLQQIEEQSGNNPNSSIDVPLRKIKLMRRHTDRLLELVNQLLDLSRLDSGKMKLQVAKGDVILVLRALAGAFESMAERKQIHYHVHFSEPDQLSFFDHDKLEKIVTNLLGNAFKYTPEKGTVSFIAETDGKRLRLSVEDSGPGIAKKELDKVFDRFYQSEGNEDKGSGIGLALVKELTDLYRGQISVNSEPGKGSRFRVSLPLDLASFKQEELVYQPGEPALENTIGHHHEPTDHTGTINAASNLPLLLIVEDNADLRNLIHEIVQHDYQVIQAVNGKEGLEKALQEIPDLIISDVMMPLMDGFELAQKIKADERTSHIPMILLTAKAGQSHKIEGLDTGADDYLTKPFDHKELLVRLRNLINQRKLLRKKFAGEIILKPSEVSVKSAEQVFLDKVMRAIEANMSEEDFGVEELAKEVTMSRSQLHRKLIALTGQSPSEVLRNTRLLRAKELLQKKAATPSEVAFRVGFNSHTYFSKCFKEEFGISPSEVS